MVAVNRKHPLAEASGFSHNAPGANEDVCLRAKITLPADFEINDTYDLLKLPAECRILDAVLISADVDTGAGAVSYDVGVIDTVQDPSDTTDTDAIFAASIIGRTGAIERASLLTCFNFAIRPYDRTVRLLIKAAASTPAAGSVELLLHVSPKQANNFDSAFAMAT